MALARLGVLAVAAAVALPAGAQQVVTGMVAETACQSLITDNRAAGGELYALKTHNPGNGPDFHRDWIFDLRAKGGASIQGVDAGGMSYNAPEEWKRPTVPPEEVFIVMTYPDGRVALDSSRVRDSYDLGVVQRHVVGNSLPVGIAAGIGLELPEDGGRYPVTGLSDRDGQVAWFPIGTREGISFAFAPLADLNANEIAAGCTIGAPIEDPHAGFGLVVGYNIYRIPGDDPTVIPEPSEFVGAWQYYAPYSAFDLTIPDGPVISGPDVNGDTIPDGVGSDAPNDPDPDGDLIGVHNPDGEPWTGDEVIIFQDALFNPDGTPRESGTPPDRTGATGYWYAVQPVIFSGGSLPTDFDGLDFGRDGAFPGNHSLDFDGDGVLESVDFDQDGSPEFYSPQVELDITGFGLTWGGFPLLSNPVFARADPAVAGLDPSLVIRDAETGPQLHLGTAYEGAHVLGYDVYRLSPRGEELGRVNEWLITARGGSGNSYVVGPEPIARRRVASSPHEYRLVIWFSGGLGAQFPPMTATLATAPPEAPERGDRTRRRR